MGSQHEQIVKHDKCEKRLILKQQQHDGMHGQDTNEVLSIMAENEQQQQKKNRNMNTHRNVSCFFQVNCKFAF